MANSDSRKMRALVVEDEWPARNYLVEILQSSGLVEVVAAVTSQQEARQVLIAGGMAVDVAFIDINLSRGAEDAGLELAREFAVRSGSPLFVLATALKQHALEAFDIGVVDYILIRNRNGYKFFSGRINGICYLVLRQWLVAPFGSGDNRTASPCAAYLGRPSQLLWSRSFSVCCAAYGSPFSLDKKQPPSAFQTTARVEDPAMSSQKYKYFEGEQAND